MPYIIKKDRAQLWKPKAFQGVSLFKAQFKHFSYSKHTHEEFAFGVIEYGVEKFYYQGGIHFAPPQAVLTVNPDEVHDGQAATERGFQYRMVYIYPEMIQELLKEFSGINPAFHYFPEPIIYDPDISRRLLYALKAFEQEDKMLLEAQACFAQVLADLFTRHARPHQSSNQTKHNPAVIRRASEFIHAHIAENLSLEEIAQEVGVSRFHFLRLFKTTTGLAPHAYLLQRRVELAKALIEQGRPLVEASHDAGFADQSHMTRRFKAAYGITPGQYQKALISS